MILLCFGTIWELCCRKGLLTPLEDNVGWGSDGCCAGENSGTQFIGYMIMVSVYINGCCCCGFGYR